MGLVGVDSVFAEGLTSSTPRDKKKLRVYRRVTTTYADVIPKNATMPAPAKAPTIRAESDVILETPNAPINWSGGKVRAISALRII